MVDNTPVTTVLTVLCLALIGYHVWKDREHRRHLESLELLVKSKDAVEFVRTRVETGKPEPEPPTDDVVPLEDVPADELMPALKKPEITTE
jgi:hypothetical protein